MWLQQVSRYRGVSTGGLRGEVPLTEDQKAAAFAYATSLGMPRERIFYSEFRNTAYGGTFDVLFIGTDVLPGTARGIGTLSANARIAMRGAIAHEIVGHRGAALAGRTQHLAVLEEAQASIRAARFAPGLTDSERRTLLRDGIARLWKEGIKVRSIKDILWVNEP